MGSIIPLVDTEESAEFSNSPRTTLGGIPRILTQVSLIPTLGLFLNYHLVLSQSLTPSENLAEPTFPHFTPWNTASPESSLLGPKFSIYVHQYNMYPF